MIRSVCSKGGCGVLISLFVLTKLAGCATATEKAPRVPEDVRKEIWLRYIEPGAAAADRGDYAGAERLVGLGIIFLDTTVAGPDEVVLAFAHVVLAGVYVAQSKDAHPLVAHRLLTDAGVHVHRVLPALKRVMTLDDPGVAVGLASLAGRQPSDPYIAHLIHVMALIARGRGDEEATKRLLLEGATSARRAAGRPDDVRVALWLADFAARDLKQGQAVVAERASQRALAIIERDLGAEHPALVTPLQTLANIYQSFGRTTEAAPVIRRLLAITEKVLGPDDVAVAKVLEAYALLLRAMNKEAEAVNLEARAHAIRRQASRASP